MSEVTLPALTEPISTMTSTSPPPTSSSLVNPSTKHAGSGLISLHDGPMDDGRVSSATFASDPGELDENPPTKLTGGPPSLPTLKSPSAAEVPLTATSSSRGPRASDPSKPERPSDQKHHTRQRALSDGVEGIQDLESGSQSGSAHKDPGKAIRDNSRRSKESSSTFDAERGASLSQARRDSGTDMALSGAAQSASANVAVLLKSARGKGGEASHLPGSHARRGSDIVVAGPVDHVGPVYNSGLSISEHSGSGSDSGSYTDDSRSYYTDETDCSEAPRNPNSNGLALSWSDEHGYNLYQIRYSDRLHYCNSFASTIVEEPLEHQGCCTIM